MSASLSSGSNRSSQERPIGALNGGLMLAVNIALMGFILVEGVASSLGAALPGDVDTLHLRLLAERIAAGAAALPEQGVSGAIVQQALTQVPVPQVG